MCSPTKLHAHVLHKWKLCSPLSELGRLFGQSRGIPSWVGYPGHFLNRLRLLVTNLFAKLNRLRLLVANMFAKLNRLRLPVANLFEQVSNQQPEKVTCSQSTMMHGG